MISKIQSYINDKGIEIQEVSDIDGKEPSQYTAHVTVGVGTPEGTVGHPISAKIVAKNIKEAFDKADAALQVEIKKFHDELKDEMSSPNIIVP